MPSVPPTIALYQPYPHTLGGLQSVVMQLARALPAAGYNPVLITPEEGKFTEAARAANLHVSVVDPGPEWHVYGRGARGLSYLASPRRVLRLIQYWRLLSTHLREQQVSVLHCNDYRAVMLAAPAARLAGIPVLWHMHGFITSKWANIIAPALVHWTVPVSNGMLDYLSIPRWLLGRYHVIYNGLDLSPAHPRSPEMELPSPLRPGSDNPVVLAVGTLHPRKGYETLLHAFARVIQRLPEAECWIVGGEFGDGECGRQLRELTQNLGLSGNVRFIGHSNNVAGYMRACSLLAIPSRIEAFGMVALEAMRQGKPVVACRTGGLKEIVLDRNTGSLVEPENPEEMAAAIVELLENKTLAEAMGRAGDARVRESFSLGSMCGAFARFYRMLLQKPA